MRALQLLLVVAAMLVASTSAWAQSDRERAAGLAEDAAALFEQGDLQDAAYRYEEAYDLAPDPSFAFNLGAIYNELGDPARTYRWFTAYLDLFPGAPDRADISAFLDDLGDDLPTSAATVRVRSNAPNARVALVGRPTPDVLGEGNVEAFVMPGNYEIEVSAEGYEPYTERFRATAGVVVAIDASLVALPDPDPVVAPQPTPVAAPVVQRNTATAGYILLGTGVAAGVGSAVMFIEAGSARDEHNELVSAITPDSPGDPDEIDRLENKSNTLTGAGIGVAVLGAAGVGMGLWLIARDNTPASVAAGPDGRGGWHFAFSYSF